MNTTDTTTTDKAATSGRAILAKFLPPTNHKGARVRAWVADDGKPLAAVVVPWNYALDPNDNFAAAALACVAKAREVSKGRFFPEAVELSGSYIGNGKHAFAIRYRNA